MKKKLAAIASVILALVISVVSLAGCNLVTTDSERDMEQAVATVSIESGVTDYVYKRDLIMDYLSYGYSYVQYSGYTMEQVMNLIVDTRVKGIILVQNAMKQLDAAGKVENYSISDKWDPARYLSREDEYKAKYDVIKGIMDMLDSFENENDPTKSMDSYSSASRTAPPNATTEKEVSQGDKENLVDEVIAQGFDINSSAKRREAFNMFINFLKINGLLGSTYANNDIMTTSYYKDSLDSSRENYVLQKYQKLTQERLLAKINLDFNDDNVGMTFADVEALYNKEIEDQSKFSNSEFVTALEQASATSPVLYGAYGTYGYVYNLLLGADDIQKDRISNIDSSLDKADKAEKRMEILASTRIKDLRSSWITSGYDFDFDSKKFTGDYTFTTAERSLPFKGSVEVITPAQGEDKAEYKATADYMGITDFVKAMHAYMVEGNFDKDIAVSVEDKSNAYANNDKLTNCILEAGAYDSVPEYREKINELIFAFSTDNGSLSSYKGYVIQPTADPDSSETYVETFAEAGRILIKQGGQNYVIVASDYGYHVMFFSEVFERGSQMSLVDYLNENCLSSVEPGKYTDDNGVNGIWDEYYADMMANFFDWEDTDNYLYVLMAAEAHLSTRITSAMNKNDRELVNTYLYETEGAVVINTDAYADLIG